MAVKKTLKKKRVIKDEAKKHSIAVHSDGVIILHKNPSQFHYEIQKMVDQFPNDQDLGRKVRALMESIKEEAKSTVPFDMNIKTKNHNPEE